MTTAANLPKDADADGRSRPDRPWNPGRLLYWGAIAGILVLLHSVHGLDGDEGVILEGAWNLLNGRQLYTQTFQYVGPASFYLVYWLWEAVGPGFWVARGLGLASELLTALAIFRTGSLLAPSNLGRYAGPALYALASGAWPALNHNTFSALFSAWALYFCVRELISRHEIDAALAGALAGVGTLVLVHKGALLLAMLGAFLTVRREGGWRSGVIFGVAAAAPLTVLLWWPLSLLFYELIEFPATSYVAANRTSLLPLGLALSWTLPLLWAVRGRRSRGVALLCVLQLAYIAASLQRTDSAHVLILMFPACALLPVAVDELSRRGPLPRRARVVYLVAGALAISTVLGAATGRMVRQWPPFRRRPENAALVAFVKEHCPSLYAGPFMPGLYFETRRLNPTSFGVLLTGLNTPGQFRRAREELAAAPPACAVLADEMGAPFGHSPRNAVNDFVARNYAPVAVVGRARIYVRNDRAAGPTP